MEHQISLSIRAQENSRQSCTDLHCDSRTERDGGDTSDCLSSPTYLSSTFPKEPVLARTSKSVSDTNPVNQRSFTFCSPIVQPIVNNDPHNRPQSILEHGAEIHLPAEQLVNDPFLMLFVSLLHRAGHQRHGPSFSSGGGSFVLHSGSTAHFISFHP
ncbi:hypothetical protein H4Q26_004670 [Puccinia striiformis f. sp. tritici PST-130]|nr:hypothetical protein H4Q26_004670 [Puccinia striiformis f. sp. tritici PST-130]